MLQITLKKYTFIFIFLVGIVLAIPVVVQAQITYPPCEKGIIRLQVAIPGVTERCSDPETLQFNPATKNVEKAPSKPVHYVKDLQSYIKGLYSFFIGLVALSAVVMIMVGGFQYLLAAGNQSRISAAKSTITNAIGGLILALVSFTLLETINPRITNLQITNPTAVRQVQQAFFCTDVPPFRFADGSTQKLKFSSTKNTKHDYTNNGITADMTECGQAYYIEGTREKSSCIGATCLNDKAGLACHRGECISALVYGKVDFDGTRFIDNDLELWAVCASADSTYQFLNVATGGLYRFFAGGTKYIGGIGLKRVAAIDLPGAQAQKVSGYAIEGSVADDICGAGLQPLGFFLKAEVNEAGAIDDFFALDGNCNFDQSPLYTCRQSGNYDPNGCVNADDVETDPDKLNWSSIADNAKDLLIKPDTLANKNLNCDIKITSSRFPAR